MRKYIISIVIVLFALNINAQSYKVIANNSNSIASLTKDEVSNYLLKRTTRWATGVAVVPVDLDTKSAVREALSKDIHKRTPTQIRSYWQQMVFSGKDTPPVEMNSDQNVIEFVKSNPGAIGYVSSGANTEGVKVISVN